MDGIKVALIQMHSIWGKTDENIEKATALVTEAKKNNADLVVLPEMFNTGVNFNDMEAGMAFAEKVDGKTMTHFRDLAKSLNCHIVCPILVEVEPKVWENSAFLLSPEGENLGGYAKTHPVGDERKLLKRGTEYPVFHTPLGKIGLSICYDASFPETTRLLVLNGAEIVVVVAAWRGTHYFKEWWDINMQCRAIDNLCYIVAANQCGMTGDDTELYAGKSQVVNPVGKLLQTAGIEEETILYQTLWLKSVERHRAFNTVLIDRHPEDYGKIAE